MINKLSFAIIGGDLRQNKLADSLKADGYSVQTYGLGEDQLTRSLGKTLKNVDIAILPLPFSLDDETVNATGSNKKIYLNELFDKLDPNTLLFGGMISSKVLSMAEAKNIKIFDYFKREELTILNSIPTAEGAIQIAMEETPFTLHGSKCLVLGYGRVGKTLAHMLYGIGANVCVGIRKYKDAAYAKSVNLDSLYLNELEEKIGKFDIIFNTIPAVILNKDILSKIGKESLVIDLASKPGGVDFDVAKDLGLRTIWALSLPGKVAPITSSNIIKETIINIIKELGVLI